MVYKELVSKSWYPLMSVLLGLFMGFFTTIFIGLNPLEVTYIFFTSLASRESIIQMLISFPACLFCALSFLLTFRSGVFNFGTPGQYVLGALFAAVFGIFLDLPPIINVPLVLLMGALGGALWAIPPAILKWKREVNEIITTLLLSFVAPILGIYVAKLPGIKDPERVNIIATLPINESAKLPSIVPGSGVNTGLILALVMAFLLYIFLWKTSIGVRIRATGLNPLAATYCGINTERVMLLAFVLSGGLAGFGGACYILGVSHAYYARTFLGLSGYGLSGLVAAFLGGMHPIGAIFSSFFFSMLTVGGLMLNIRARVPVDYVVLIQGLILGFVAMPLLMKKILGGKALRMVGT